jgi:hypothetical protein
MMLQNRAEMKLAFKGQGRPTYGKLPWFQISHCNIAFRKPSLVKFQCDTRDDWPQLYEKCVSVCLLFESTYL